MVLGPWINRPWLNIVATLIVAVLIMLSMILVVSTLIPSIDATALLKELGVVVAVIVVAVSAWIGWTSRHAVPEPEVSRTERENWRMPALALLERPTWSNARRAAMLVMGAYLVVAVVLLAVKAVQLAIG